MGGGIITLSSLYIFLYETATYLSYTNQFLYWHKQSYWVILYNYSSFHSFLFWKRANVLFSSCDFSSCDIQDVRLVYLSASPHYWNCQGILLNSTISSQVAARYKTTAARWKDWTHPQLQSCRIMAQLSIMARKALGPLMFLFVGFTSVLFYSRLGRSPLMTRGGYEILKEKAGQ